MGWEYKRIDLVFEWPEMISGCPGYDQLLIFPGNLLVPSLLPDQLLILKQSPDNRQVKGIFIRIKVKQPLDTKYPIREGYLVRDICLIPCMCWI